MFGRIGPMELVLILVIALVIFGPKKLPEIGKAIGTAINEFKKHSNKVSAEIEEAVNSVDEGPKVESAKMESAKTEGAKKAKTGTDNKKA